MITALVFIDAEANRIPEVADKIASLPGVTEVYSVTGAIDLIAMVRVRSHDEIADVITSNIAKVEGIIKTETHIAFGVYSSHDLDAAFSLGD